LIRNFIRERINFILEIYSDLGFFLGSVSFAKKLSEAGLDVCLPEVSQENKKEYSVKGLYNCLLFSESGMNGKEIVSNDIELSYHNTFAVLNGPNRGGKTTIVQAVALSMILFQLGIYVPCKKASMKPADIILTHYQREEDGAIKGRLAMEAESMRFILENASHNSFVILNEPFVSTSPSEGMILILNSLYGIRELGCRGILVTHFHSLNKGIEEDNSESEYKIKFFHMGIEKDGEKRTFILENGQGKPVSYALDILAEYAPGLIDT
jgi:DNA mismatch repair ATPase MutS